MPPRAAEVDAQQLCLYFSKRMHMHALAPAPHHKKELAHLDAQQLSSAMCVPSDLNAADHTARHAHGVAADGVAGAVQTGSGLALGEHSSNGVAAVQQLG